MFVFNLILFLLISLIHLLIATYAHEYAHKAEFNRCGIPSSIRLGIIPSCSTIVGDVLNCSAEERISQISAGYVYNCFLASVWLIVAFILCCFNNNICNNMCYAAFAGVGVQLLFALVNYVGTATTDGCRVRAIKRAVNDYTLNPTMNNLIILTITKLYGNYAKQNIQVIISGNTAEINNKGTIRTLVIDDEGTASILNN